MCRLPILCVLLIIAVYATAELHSSDVEDTDELSDDIDSSESFENDALDADWNNFYRRKPHDHSKEKKSKEKKSKENKHSKEKKSKEKKHSREDKNRPIISDDAVFLPHERFCKYFYEFDGSEARLLSCPKGHRFDAEKLQCLKSKEVDCGKRKKNVDSSEENKVRINFKCPRWYGLHKHEYYCHLYYNCQYKRVTVKQNSTPDLDPDEPEDKVVDPRPKFNCNQNFGRFTHEAYCNWYYQCHDRLPSTEMPEGRGRITLTEGGWGLDNTKVQVWFCGLFWLASYLLQIFGINIQHLIYDTLSVFCRSPSYPYFQDNLGSMRSAKAMRRLPILCLLLIIAVCANAVPYSNEIEDADELSEDIDSPESFEDGLLDADMNNLYKPKPPKPHEKHSKEKPKPHEHSKEKLKPHEHSKEKPKPPKPHSKEKPKPHEHSKEKPKPHENSKEKPKPPKPHSKEKPKSREHSKEKPKPHENSKERPKPHELSKEKKSKERENSKETISKEVVGHSRENEVSKEVINRPTISDDAIFLPHEKFCQYFYVFDGVESRLLSCAKGHHFDAEKLQCMKSKEVNCGKRKKKIGGSEEKKIGINFKCPKWSGLHKHEYYCHLYYSCQNKKAQLFMCPPGMLFDERSLTCSYRRNVDCKKRIDPNEYVDDEADELIDPNEPTYECYGMKGVSPHPSMCNKYIRCWYGYGDVYVCPRGYMFDEDLLSCQPKKYVYCDDRIDPYGYDDEEEPVLVDNRPDYICPESKGRFRHGVCAMYYECVMDKAMLYACPPEKLFDAHKETCRKASEVSCNDDIDNDTEEDFICPAREGIFKSEADCSSYYKCSKGRAQRLWCSQGELFDTDWKSCADEDEVTCGDRQHPKNDPEDESDDNVIDARPNYRCEKRFGRFTHQEVCNYYYNCKDGNPSLRVCRNGRYYDVTSNSCQYEVDCGNRKPDYEQRPTIQPEKFVCPSKSGKYPHERDCSAFYKCDNRKYKIHYCSKGKLYNERKRTCESENKVTCGSRIHPDMDPDEPEDKVIDPYPNYYCDSNFGRYRHDDYCNWYYQCSDGRPSVRECKRGKRYDSYSRRCRVKDEVSCDGIPDNEEEPITDEPETEKPVTEEPVTEEPDTKRPDTEKPITEEPDTEEPITEEPDTEEPDTEEPITEEPDTEEPITEEPDTEGTNKPKEA
ncbi:hypothetical protein HNY73_012417 [Argiope bruennichi]|uniref:Chitin-binding type-2 domain-containing protein n=1 Tax=Argiope bruennichi TaxID=94029 RepID=A0A8T0EWY1_ARGBR|nr:hypothetical protein HNY73_012417 [Argiope bruennichi]